MADRINNVCIINCFDTYEHRVDLLHDYFKSIGAKVRVITSDYRHFEKCRRTDRKEDFDFVEAIPYTKNLSVARLKSHSVLSKTIFKKIEDETFDILWVLVPPNSFVKDAAKYKNTHKETKLIFDLIDLWPETMPISKFKSLPPFTYWKNLRDKYLYAADEIVTECNLYHEKLPKRIDKKKIHTIYLAREIKEYNPKLNLPDDKIALCYLGSINNIIDIPTIVEIVKKLSEIKPVMLHVIGDGEKRVELIQQCEKAGAEVIYHGKVYDSREKQEIFDSCHYGLNIMKDSVFVGLTMKSMDYFEYGLPIINNIHGDTWDVIEKNGLGYNFHTNLTKEIAQPYDSSQREHVRNFFIENLGIESFNNDISAVLHREEKEEKDIRVVAGIVTYNPDVERLKQNIKSIYNQVEKIVIVDNGSDNIESISELQDDRIFMICNGRNQGIAYALNEIMKWAQEAGYGWAITLDQDSICPNNYVEKAKAFLDDCTIGQIIPILYESKTNNYHYLGDKPNGECFQYVKKSITSASITSVYAWGKIGGFDNDLFIDYVDYDYAIKLRKSGFKILRLNGVRLDHQIGNSVNKNFGPFHIRVANHSAFRKYYISRNMVIFMRRYFKDIRVFGEILRLGKVIILTVLYEDNKKEKLLSIKKGIVDGLQYQK